MTTEQADIFRDIGEIFNNIYDHIQPVPEINVYFIPIFH